MNRVPKDPSSLLNAFNLLNEWLWPYLKTFLLAGNAAVGALLISTGTGVDFSADQRKLWVWSVVAVGMAGSVAWMWILPRRDFLVVCEQGFRWRIWLSKWNTLPSKGTIQLSELRELLYSSSWGTPQDLQIRHDATTPEKVTALVMFLAFNVNTLEIAEGNRDRRVIENFFIRFERADLERFLNYVSDKASQAVRRID